ncbi:hypothetical protein [Mucilaginibacter antarcticus]|uniref:hypothetical protein n=1 Tax=Mucilaginibacter antarcticus TaxID=1855725 RepID=UPI003636F7FA
MIIPTFASRERETPAGDPRRLSMVTQSVMKYKNAFFTPELWHSFLALLRYIPKYFVAKRVSGEAFFRLKPTEDLKED